MCCSIMAHFRRFCLPYEDEDHDNCREPTDTGVLVVGIIFFVIVGCCVGACIIVVVFLGVEWCRSLWRERQQRQEQETRRQEVLARAIARRRPTTENRKEYVKEHALYSHTLEQGESARNLPALLASANDDDEENDTTVPPQGNVFTRMWRKTEESARSVRESIRNKAGPKPVCSICLQEFATE